MYLIEHWECQVLSLLPQLLQLPRIPLQVQEVEADCSNFGEHLSRQHAGNQDMAGWAESSEKTNQIYQHFALKAFFIIIFFIDQPTQ